MYSKFKHYNKITGGDGSFFSLITSLAGLSYTIIKNYIQSIGSIKKKQNIYIIPYKYKGVNYSIPLIIKLGPKPVIEFAMDHNGNDVTSEIISYQGPYGNFNEIPLTPYMLGYESLSITFDEYTRVFEKHDIISLEKKN